MHAPPPDPCPAEPAWEWLEKPALQALLDVLAERHRVVGPRVADGAIVLADLAHVAELPAGWLDEQDGGSYRLVRDDAAGWFDHVVGPHSLKNFLFPARDTVARLERVDGSWRQAAPPSERPLAVIGVRGCDLAALAIQDRIFIGGEHCDPAYKARRDALFVVAVECRRAAATCFCHSLGTGPAAGPGFDLALTEFTGRFAVRIGSDRGREAWARVRDAAAGAVRPCSAAEAAEIRAVPQALRARMTARQPAAGGPAARSLDTTGIRDLLYDNPEHPRWEEVASRCLSCTNCTAVCPTCFCAGVTEVADLAGDRVDRERHWVSCFTLDHSRMHGTSVRGTTASRYRQWLTHKLAGWIDQFGTSGCTGCGRCITWCPVGIDLTAEVAAIRGTAAAPPGSGAP